MSAVNMGAFADDVRLQKHPMPEKFTEPAFTLAKEEKSHESIDVPEASSSDIFSIYDIFIDDPEGENPSRASGASNRRDKHLPADAIESADPVAAKGVQNTLAARRSWQRETEEREALVSQVQKLEVGVEH